MPIIQNNPLIILLNDCINLECINYYMNQSMFKNSKKLEINDYKFSI